MLIRCLFASDINQRYQKLSTVYYRKKNKNLCITLRFLLKKPLSIPFCFRGSNFSMDYLSVSEITIQEKKFEGYGER